MFPRRIHSVILESLRQFPAVGLVGPRQSGKTTLARMFMEKLDQGVVYLDLENPRDLQKLEDTELYLQQYPNHLVIFDEAQRKPELFPLLRSLIDQDRRPGRFMILGSASPSLKRQASESLAGRIAYHELSPLTWDEVQNPEADINSLWLRGGYPDSYLARDDQQSFLWLKNFIQTHLERDLPALGVRIPATTLLRFWTMTAHCQGQTWNASKIAASLGTDSKTIRRYLDLLSDTFMIRQLPPFFANTKKRLIKSSKVYIRDAGLLHSLLQIHSQEQLHSHPILGASWEGFCLEQILALRPPLGYEAYFYRTRAGAEIDLVLAQGMQPQIAIEIKHSLSPKLTKSSRHALEDLQPKVTYLIYPGTERFPLQDKIWALPITEIQTIFND